MPRSMDQVSPGKLPCHDRADQCAWRREAGDPTAHVEGCHGA